MKPVLRQQQQHNQYPNNNSDQINQSSQIMQYAMNLPIRAQSISFNHVYDIIIENDSGQKRSKLLSINQNANRTQTQVHSKYNSNIKEILNTSAPLCISSYVQNDNQQSVVKKAPIGNGMSRIQSAFHKQSNLNQAKVQGSFQKNKQQQQMLNMTTLIHSNQSQEDFLKRSTTLQNTNVMGSSSGYSNYTTSGMNQINPNLVGGTTNAHTLNKRPQTSYLNSSLGGQGYAGDTNSRDRQQFKYQENDGFMRGARIAEKIQEFYHQGKNSQDTNNTKTVSSINQSIHIRTNRISQQQSQIQQNKPRATSSYGNSNKRVMLQYQNQRMNQQDLSQTQEDVGVAIRRKKASVDMLRNRNISQEGSRINQSLINTTNLNQIMSSNTMMIEDNTTDQDFQINQNNQNRLKETIKVSDILQSHEGNTNQLLDSNIFSHKNLTQNINTEVIQNQIPASQVQDNFQDQAAQAQNNEQISNNEIRKIKLNYIQLNKRVGTSYQLKRPSNQTALQQQTLSNKVQPTILASSNLKEKINIEAKNEYTNQTNYNQTVALMHKQQNIDANQLIDKLFYNDIISDDKSPYNAGTFTQKGFQDRQGEDKQNQDRDKNSQVQKLGTHNNLQERAGSQSELYDLQFCSDGSTADNLDSYIIGKRIGQGAYAVSVKREIKIMERLDHKGIAKLYEAFDTHKQVFLIMEYVNGGSLHGYLKSKPNRQMHEIEAKYLFKQVVSALYYCHQRNVTHRDIKLENILLNDGQNQVKLIDFGFSTCIPNDKKIKLFCGTPSYMAPEIVSKKEYCGPPADVWALGVLLFALLCGRFPYRGQNDKELYKRICRAEPEFPDHVSLTARTFFAKIFRRDPDHRITTKEMLKDQFLNFADIEYEAFVSGKSTSQRNSSSYNQSGRALSQPADVSRQDTKSGVAERAISADKLKNLIKEQNKKNQNNKTQPNKQVLQQINTLQSSFDLNHNMKSSESFIKKNKINMEAYNAYYNTNEQNVNGSTNQYGHTQGIPSQHNLLNSLGREVFPSQFTQQQTQPSIVNNIMHISYGANVNITTQPNSQNNFIFNHTAPINLNFYKKQSQSKVGLDAGDQSMVNQTAELIDPDFKDFDQEIIQELMRLGHSKEQIKDQLRDNNSQISVMYQKLIDDKLQQQINNKLSATNIMGIGELNSLGSSLGKQFNPITSDLQTDQQYDKHQRIGQPPRAASHSIGRVTQKRQDHIGVQDIGSYDNLQFK
eukprot:403365841